MSAGPATILSICADVVLAIFAAALLFLVIWQDRHRRSNQYFGLCMAVFALYGGIDAAWQVPQQFDLQPEPLLYATSTLYVLGIILLFNFTLAFAGVPRRVRQIEHWVSAPLGIIFLGLMWFGQLYRDLEPRTNGSYDYSYTTLGLVGVGIVLAYLLANIVLLYTQGQQHIRALSAPLLLLIAGQLGHTLSDPLHTYSFNLIAITVAVVMVGRLVVKYQVFQPLADLNQQLAAKNEQLLVATQMKSQFLANMSHELRTPLNSIIGYTELVTAETYGALTERQQDRLAKVTNNGRLLLELINDVLDLSKIDAGRLDLKLTTVPAGAMLDSLLDSFEPRAREKGLALVRGYGTLPPLHVDETRTRQIISNLLSNAIKFTNQGVVIVRGHYDTDHQQVILSVTDTGIGIPPEQQPFIFEAFHQADGSLTRRYEGTGLGLAIARRLAELHGGRIWFETTPGRGSTFHVALPAASSHPQVIHTLEPKARRAGGPVILAIDDDTETLEVLQDILQAENFRVYGTTDANEGLRLAHELHPALITLDVHMPGMDGWQVLEALRRDPHTAHTAVLIVSATEEHDVAHKLGAAGFLAKPIDPPTLLAHVRRLLAADRQEAHG